MAFTTGNIAAFEAALKAAGGALFELQQVDLYQGASVQVKLYVGTRRANENDMTAGAAADTNLVATIDYDDWNTKAPRPPQKGDVVWRLGKRYAITKSVAVAAASNGMFYKADLEG